MFLWCSPELAAGGGRFSSTVDSDKRLTEVIPVSELNGLDVLMQSASAAVTGKVCGYMHGLMCRRGGVVRGGILIRCLP